jgi:hypothetical protein
MENVDILSREDIPRVLIYITQVINEHVEKQRTQKRSLTNTEEHFKRR